MYLDAATAEDVAALLALERESFTHPWTEGNFREALANVGRVSTLVLREVTPTGGRPALVAAYCVFQLVADELHILDLAVGPEQRRRGLARWLLSYCLDHARRRGAGRAFLEVRRSNEPARGLYTSFGFRVVGERPDYYGDPREDALVLEKSGLRGPSERDGKDP